MDTRFHGKLVSLHTVVMHCNGAMKPIILKFLLEVNINMHYIELKISSDVLS